MVSLVDVQVKVLREVGSHNNKLGFVPWEIAPPLQPTFPLVQLSASLALISFPPCLFSWLKSSFPAPSDHGPLLFAVGNSVQHPPSAGVTADRVFIFWEKTWCPPKIWLVLFWE